MLPAPIFAMGPAIAGATTGPGPAAVDVSGTPDADTLHGSNFADTMDGLGGDDTLYGYGGDDSLSGGGGVDRLFGGEGNDRLSGGDGNDQLWGEAVNEQLEPAAGNDMLDGGAGNDRLTSSWGADTLLGGAGNDVLIVSAASSSLPASSYQVTLDGGDGQDRLVVSSSVGSSVTVSMSGGAGSDTFELPQNMRVQGATRIVTDFQAGAGGDVLDMFEPMGFVRQSPFASGFFLLEQRGADTVVRYDDNGPGATGPVFDVVILKGVMKEALTADNMRYGHAPDGAPTVLTPEQRGTDGRDRLDGDAHSNALYGGDDNDILAGFAGNDYLNGAKGIDTAVYRGAADQYAFNIANLEDFTVSDLRGGAQDGKDRLVGVERLLFADKALAIAVGEDGGTAFQAYRIYRAAFDRPADEVGLGFWIAMMDRGSTLHDIAGGFVRSQEFIDLYGAAPGNAELVTKLYRNILDRDPEQAGFEFWLDALDRKLVDLPSLLAAFSESRENQDAVWGLVGNGVFYQPYGS